MNLLCIDIGNTSTSFSKVTNNVIGDLHRIISDDESIEFIRKYDFNGIDEVIICSVVPLKTTVIKENLKSMNINNLTISYENCCVDLKVDNPSEVGADRLCNIAGVKSKGNFPAIVFDFGTATTYDAIDKDGKFIGGAIAPGIDISANHLINKTALLRETIYHFPSSVIGKNTTTNIQSGVMIGGLKSVQGMIDSISKELNYEDVKIILTGGFGKLISEKLDIPHEYNEKLIIIGMLHIYENNK